MGNKNKEIFKYITLYQTECFEHNIKLHPYLIHVRNEYLETPLISVSNLWYIEIVDIFY